MNDNTLMIHFSYLLTQNTTYCSILAKKYDELRRYWKRNKWITRKIWSSYVI